MSGAEHNWYYTTARPVLELRGEGILDFLNRISTNDLAALPASRMLGTIFLNEKGRYIDGAEVIPLGSSVLLVGIGTKRGTLASWLRKFIIMEDISVTDAAQFSAVHTVFRESAEPAAGAVAGASEPVNRTDGRLAYRTPIWPGTEIVVTADPASAAGMLPGNPLTAEKYDQMRIESGIPSPGAELTEEYNPLEMSLQRLISFTKGCYTGQEVIARIDTYKKLRRRLTRIISADPDRELRPGMIVFDDGGIYGKVTSACLSAVSSRWIGLGYRALTPDQGAGGDAVPVRFTDLPYSQPE
ncbi:MAG TPA: hypothetical protein VMW43_12020 [Bacteroidota bacterium]|nr:hypothetical protein [Bacteroidota bacterium]